MRSQRALGGYLHAYRGDTGVRHCVQTRGGYCEQNLGLNTVFRALHCWHGNLRLVAQRKTYVSFTFHMGEKRPGGLERTDTGKEEEYLKHGGMKN